MQRRLNSILDCPLPPFCEDVYLLDKNGNVILGRQGSNINIKNIYDTIDKCEIEFINSNIIFSNISPLFLVSAADKGILLDLSLLNKKGVFLAIIPHFSKEQALEIIKTECSFVLLSPKIRELMPLVNERELEADETAFAERIKLLHYSEIYNSQAHGRTNLELADMMLGLARDYSLFVGCDLDCHISGVSIFELQNELCIYSYKFMLLAVCFAVRRYSEQRNARMDICFDDVGISMSVVFEIEDIYKNTKFSELINLVSFARNADFLFEYTQSEKKAFLCGYLWQHSADYEHIKKNPIDLKYEKEGE
ncbi:MAG: hypothetical protein IKA84_03515 [Clostridia bacterium]|nr:hypothetical protein [Clostridia bacterium]